jgi:hypothetical protein
MSTSRNQLIGWAIVGLVVVIFYFGNQSRETEHQANSVSESTGDTGNPDRSPNTFAGYECTQDCSGHRAGYAWAEEHDITDGDACDAAGEHSNSPSFAEGCHAYVDGDAESEQSEDTDDN